MTEPMSRDEAEAAVEVAIGNLAATYGPMPDGALTTGWLVLMSVQDGTRHDGRAEDQLMLLAPAHLSAFATIGMLDVAQRQGIAQGD